MTTTITVKTRALGAVASLRTVGGAASPDEFEIGPQASQTFHVDSNHVLEVKQLGHEEGTEEGETEEAIAASSTERDDADDLDEG